MADPGPHEHAFFHHGGVDFVRHERSALDLFGVRVHGLLRRAVFHKVDSPGKYSGGGTRTPLVPAIGSRLVKKLMRHNCSTSITRRGAPDSVLGFGFLLANFFRREQEDVTFPLVVSLAVKMINEVGERPSQ